MSNVENVIPDWVQKRRYSTSFNRKTLVALGLGVGFFGFFIVIASFYAKFDIEDVCTAYTCTLTNPGTPLGNALDLLDLVIVAGAALASGGLAYGISTWRTRDSDWAAAFGLQPFAKRLQLYYSQGKLSKQQVNEILADLEPRKRPF